jgi:hypothetical protein
MSMLLWKNSDSYYRVDSSALQQAIRVMERIQTDTLAAQVSICMAIGTFFYSLVYKLQIILGAVSE